MPQHRLSSSHLQAADRLSSPSDDPPDDVGRAGDLGGTGHES